MKRRPWLLRGLVPVVRKFRLQFSVHIMQLNVFDPRGRFLMYRVSTSKVNSFAAVKETSLIIPFIDCSLEVLWYDSQGCIRSYALDIVRQLPLLVVLIAVQHSSPYLPGLVTQDIPEKYQEVDEIARRFQLVGRMTYCAYLVETPATAPTTSATGRPLRAKSAAQLPQQTRNDASHFFKVSWPEDDRLTHKSEGEIIKEARARADALPEELRKIVTEHIPDVREQGVIPNSSTAIIRTIFGLNTAGSRSQYWMVSKKLLSLSSILDDFNVFKRVYWEFIRCA